MTNNSIKFLATSDDLHERLDIILTKHAPELSRSNIKKIIDLKKVLVNSIVVTSPSKKLKLNDKVEFSSISEDRLEIKPSKIKLDIVYEDKDIIIINKPAGMVVHPGAGNYENTLVNALAYKFKNNLSDINGNARPGIVHRIDKETSGLLVVAKNNKTHAELGRQFSAHTIERTYLALTWGVVRPLNGRIETSIGRNKKNRQLMCVTEMSGKKAITNYLTKKIFTIKDVPKISLLECRLETGRTHQIRVHLSYMGNSLLGDKQYGRKNLKFKKINEDFKGKLELLNRQALHAKTLGFIHPSKKKLVTFDSKLPKDFKKLLDLLNKLSG